MNKWTSQGQRKDCVDDVDIKGACAQRCPGICRTRVADTLLFDMCFVLAEEGGCGVSFGVFEFWIICLFNIYQHTNISQNA